MNKLVLFAGVAFTATAIFTACSTSEETTASTSEWLGNPFTEARPQVQDFTFSNAEERRFHLPSGTNIIIPPNIFQNKSGEPVTDVRMEYEEYHDATDIILSGLPMKYDSAGTEHDFRSAGMFTIRVYPDDNSHQLPEELELRPGKSLEVQMASFREGDDYSFYQLNDETNAWDYEGIAAPVPNVPKQEAMAALEEQKPVEPLQPQKPLGNQMFNLDVNYRKIPQLEKFDRVLWEYAGGGKSLPEAESKILASGDWNNVDVEQDESGTYFLVFSSGSETQKVEVVPVLTGKEYETASNDYASGLAAFQSKIDSYQSEMEALGREADLLRSFNVTNLGACNWDTFTRLVAEGARRMIAADFKFEGNVAAEDAKILLVTHDGASVVRYDRNTWHRMIFNPQEDNKLIAILPNDEVAYFKGDINRAKHDQDFTFDMKAGGKKKSATEIREFINSI